jgi:hypothetical protein
MRILRAVRRAAVAMGGAVVGAAEPVGAGHGADASGNVEAAP